MNPLLPVAQVGLLQEWSFHNRYESALNERHQQWEPAAPKSRIGAKHPLNALDLIQSLDIDLSSGCVPDPNDIYHPSFPINPVGYLPGLKNQFAPPGILLLRQNRSHFRMASQYLCSIINTESDLAGDLRSVPHSYVANDPAEVID